MCVATAYNTFCSFLKSPACTTDTFSLDILFQSNSTSSSVKWELSCQKKWVDVVMHPSERLCSTTWCSWKDQTPTSLLTYKSLSPEIAELLLNFLQLSCTQDAWRLTSSFWVGLKTWILTKWASAYSGDFSRMRWLMLAALALANQVAVSLPRLVKDCFSGVHYLPKTLPCF